MKPIKEILELAGVTPDMVAEIKPTEDFFSPGAGIIRGYHFRLNNGRVVSMQSGPGNYCSMRRYDNAGFRGIYPASNLFEFSPDCEIATWVQYDAENGSGLQDCYNSGDTVKGYVNEEELIDFIKRIIEVDAAYPGGVCDLPRFSHLMSREYVLFLPEEDKWDGILTERINEVFKIYTQGGSRTEMMIALMGQEEYDRWQKLPKLLPEKTSDEADS